MKKKGANVQKDFGLIFGELKSSLESTNNETETIEIETIEENDNFLQMEAAKVAPQVVDKEQKPITLNFKDAGETESSGIHSTSIRVVKEELLKALAGRQFAEIKIGDLAPLTGLTRRTVDRVCKYLEKAGEFSFERLHRGMKVTSLKD